MPSDPVKVEPLVEAANGIARGLGSMMRWSDYEDEFGLGRFHEGVEMLTGGLFLALKILRGDRP